MCIFLQVVPRTGEARDVRVGKGSFPELVDEVGCEHRVFHCPSDEHRAVVEDDNIGYADLSDFFYIWLRRSLNGELRRGSRQGSEHALGDPARR